MPYYRRPYYRRKKRTYRKRNYKKSRPTRPMKTIKKQPVHYFKRHVDLGNLVSDGVTTETVGNFQFSLNDVPGYTEFTSLYDSYKIVAVKISFLPIYDNFSGTAFGNDEAFMRMMSCIDYNDVTAATTLAAIREYSNCKVTPNNKIHKRFFYPKPIVDNDFEFSTSPWVNTSDVTINYCGIKYGWEQPSSSTLTRWRVEAVYYMKFKSYR